ncbi:hypothetical protein GIB67_036747 [Kingdonia uniflora]|uniref:Uncharacterized protein n=1 Tax=Kingdonia uniflora TaxID=39325 RepID=A0A7J7LWV3_9MAGN|nr:hypothetical protein GIB67_036747 [Kingdonia uniflora]
MEYSKAEVNDIMEGTYIKEEEDEVDVAGVVGGLDGISPKIERENQGEYILNPENENGKLSTILPVKDIEFWLVQRCCNELNERVPQLKIDLALENSRVKNVEARECSRKNKGNEQLREYRSKLDDARVREQELKQAIKGKDLLIRKNEELLKKSPAREGVERELEELRAQVVELRMMNQAQLNKVDEKAREHINLMSHAVKTHSQRAVEARVLNDLRLAFKIDEIRKAVSGQQGYDAVLLETRANYEVRLREEIINEDMDIASELLKACGVVRHTGCFKCKYLGTKRLRDMLKYNIWCNDGKVLSPKRYDTSDRFRRTDGSVQELRTAYWKTPNRQRFGERCISTPSLPSRNTENKKKKRRVIEREILTDDSITVEGGKDKGKVVTRSLNCKIREEAEIEVLKKLQKLSKLVRTNAADSHSVLKISMASISGWAKADEAGLVGHLTPNIRVGDEEDTVAEFIEWPHLKGARVEYPTGSSRFREFCKARSSIDGIWGHALGYRGNFFRTCSVSQGGDYLYLLPDLAKEKKYRHFGDEVSLEYIQGTVKDSRTDGFCYYLAQFDYGLTLPLSNLVKSVMNMIRACPAQLNCNFWEVILVCKTLNGRWAASGSERRITAKDFLEYYAVKYVTATDGAYLSSSSSKPYFFDLSSAGRVWNDNLLWVSGECLQRSDKEPLELNNRTITKGINCKVSRKESFIAREGTELEAILKELEISRLKRVANKNEKVRRSQAKRRMAGKIAGSMEEKLLTPELNKPLKLARLNEMPDGPVDMDTVSSTVVRNLAKRKAIKRGIVSRSVTSDSVDDSNKKRKVEAGLLEEQCQAKAREKMGAAMDDEFKKFARALREVQLGFQDRSIELEKRISQLKGEKNQLEENLTRERETFQLEREKEREAATLKLKEVRAESEAEAE